MADIEKQMNTLWTRQEEMIAAMHGLTDMLEQVRNLQTEMMAWMQEPPSTDLPDALRSLGEAIEAQNELILTMHGDVVKAVAGR